MKTGKALFGRIVRILQDRRRPLVCRRVGV